MRGFGPQLHEALMGLRLGIPMVGGAHWHGGVTYIEAIVKSFRTLSSEEQPELYLIVESFQVAHILDHAYFLAAFDGYIIQCESNAIPESIRARSRIIRSFIEIDEHVDFIFPVNSDVLPGFPYATWLPDFQHRQLPHMFSEADFNSRETALKRVLASASNIVVSSENAKSDLLTYYPSYKGRIAVVRFFSRFDASVLALDPDETARRYQLPENYLICCNQFWQHKNHDTLFRALALTKNPVHLVCTGAQVDYRNKDWFNSLKQIIAEFSLESRITLLGFISRSDQIQLIRAAQGLVQPSLFEGWSTVMEDARGLDKQVIASDIEVHREQDLPNACYFDPKSSVQLAELLDRLYTGQQSGVQAESESNAQAEVERRQCDSAGILMNLFNEALHERESEKATAAGCASIYTQMTLTSRARDLQFQLHTIELDRANRGEQIHTLTAQIHQLQDVLQDIEVDRAARGEQIQTLTARIRQLEAALLAVEVERKARGERIHIFTRWVEDARTALKISRKELPVQSHTHAGRVEDRLGTRASHSDGDAYTAIEAASTSGLMRHLRSICKRITIMFGGGKSQ
jgi:glycosyltransferase involved in cell wall biosynthesis